MELAAVAPQGPDFQARLRERIEKDREVIERLSR